MSAGAVFSGRPTRFWRSRATAAWPTSAKTPSSTAPRTRRRRSTGADQVWRGGNGRNAGPARTRHRHRGHRLGHRGRIRTSRTACSTRKDFTEDRGGRATSTATAPTSARSSRAAAGSRSKNRQLSTSAWRRARTSSACACCGEDGIGLRLGRHRGDRLDDPEPRTLRHPHHQSVARPSRERVVSGRPARARRRARGRDRACVVVSSAGNFGKLEDGTPVVGGIVSPGYTPSALTVGALNTRDTVDAVGRRDRDLQLARSGGRRRTIRAAGK